MGIANDPIVLFCFFFFKLMKSKYRLVQDLSYLVASDITCKEYERKEFGFLYACNGTRAP